MAVDQEPFELDAMDQPARPLTVAKLGGSLLAVADYAQRLQLWADRMEPPGHLVLIVGGGRRADRVRARFAGSQVGMEEAHWLSIEAMRENTGQLHRRIPRWAFCNSLEQLSFAVSKAGRTIFDPFAFLRAQEPHLRGRKLVKNWDATSDSIAARLAIVLCADQLVLLKSAVPPKHRDVEQLAQLGYVDRFLPQIIGGIPASSAANLLDPTLPHYPLACKAVQR